MILIVDDHLDTCRALLELLRREGISAECVDDPKTAVRLVETLRPALLVLDQMMPGLNGTEVLRAVRAVPALAAIPAIFYSAAEEGREEARRLGALDWLSKGGTSWIELRQRIVAVYRSRTSAPPA